MMMTKWKIKSESGIAIRWGLSWCTSLKSETYKINYIDTFYTYLLPQIWLTSSLLVPHLHLALQPPTSHSQRSLIISFCNPNAIIRAHKKWIFKTWHFFTKKYPFYHFRYKWMRSRTRVSLSCNDFSPLARVPLFLFLARSYFLNYSQLGQV